MKKMKSHGVKMSNASEKMSTPISIPGNKTSRPSGSISKGNTTKNSTQNSTPFDIKV